MCTQVQVKEALVEVLYDHDEDGESIFGREVNKHITNKGNQIVTKLTLRVGIGFITLLLTGSAAWFAQAQDSKINAINIEKNTETLNEGGRWTKENAQASNAEIQRQILELQKADAELKKDQIEATNAVRSDIKELRSIILNQ